MTTKLIVLLGLLAMFLAYPRVTIMGAVVVATICTLVVRYLLHHRTVFQVGHRPAVVYPIPVRGVS